MALEELPIFMAAMRRIESGAFGGNYGIAKAGSLGAYQISAPNWNKWATEAGLDGAAWQSTAAQDTVAVFKMRQFYDRYGDWRLVQVAWLFGTDAADAAAGGLADNPDTKALIEAMHQAQADGWGQQGEGDKVLSVDTDLEPYVVPGTEPVPEAEPGSAVAAAPVEQGPIAVGRERALSDATADSTTNPFTARQLEGSDMHKNMSAILQGLSNSIRNAANTPGEAEVPLETEEVVEETPPAELGIDRLRGS